MESAGGCGIKGYKRLCKSMFNAGRTWTRGVFSRGGDLTKEVKKSEALCNRGSTNGGGDHPGRKKKIEALGARQPCHLLSAGVGLRNPKRKRGWRRRGNGKEQIC